MDEVLGISGIIKVEVSVQPKPRLITLTSTLIIPDITKTESNNCFIIHCFKENKDRPTVEETNQRADFAVCKMPLTARELEIALGNHALRV